MNINITNYLQNTTKILIYGMVLEFEREESPNGRSYINSEERKHTEIMVNIPKAHQSPS